MKYSVTKIASILGIRNQQIIEGEISILLTDSRKLTNASETLFFALKTNNNDAHKFVSELYASGVRNFVVSKIFPEWSMFKEVNFLLVSNPLIALQRLARYHRGRFDYPVIGIS